MRRTPISVPAPLRASVEGVLDVLSSASKLLSSATDFDAALPAILALLVPQWADGGAIGLIDEAGVPHPAAALGVSVLERAGLWALNLPLSARGQSFGQLRLVGAGAEPPPILTPLAEELALRIAIAIDTARTIAREHHVADTLQRALLPDHLPRGEQIAFDAAYRPGASESIVGGDWYDAFELPDGRIAFSIGDVAGHGLSAAVVMSEVRQAVRASALNAVAPSSVLMRANQMLTMRASQTMVTALCGIYDPSSSMIVYASAGHPPPILGSPDGRVHTLPKGGIPLGVIDEIDASDWTFSLVPGSLLVLYTDGLVEYSRDIEAGEIALHQAIADQLGNPSPSPAKSLLERIFGFVENTDDVATLTLFVAPRKLDKFNFTFSAIPFSAPLVRRSLERFLNENGIDDDGRFRIITAVGEAVANAIEHAYGEIPGTVRLAATIDDEIVRLAIDDSGRWRPAHRNEMRGRGIPLMRALMDGVEIRTDSSSTKIRMRLRIAG